MKSRNLHRLMCAAILMLLTLPAVRAADTPGPWLDNERQFKSDDPGKLFRRSEHFRIAWGMGVGKQKEENADFGNVTEQLAQGNLQMLEQVWHRYHDPAPRGMGFHPDTGLSSNEKFNDGKRYRTNLVMNNTGIWAGGAWGACDEWGFPLFALPPSYLGFDPPSGATPHEYGHTVLINAGGFNETPFDGMWHEATSDWVMLQFNNSYPGPGSVGVQPYLSLPHGRNYYDAWQIYEYLRENPRYGYPFINKLWTQANGNRAKGGEYIFDAMARLDTSGSPDPYNAIKDALGGTAAHNVMWDYERGPFFRKQCIRTSDFFEETYRRAYTELVRRNGDKTWFRVPFAHAPMQGGYNVVPIALDGKQGGGYKVSIDFKPLWDASRGSDWRATFVAVNDQGESRYSTMWNGGVNSITLAADENKLYLAVSATPDFRGFEGFARPLPSDPVLQPQAYEVSFIDTKATAYESKPARPQGVAGKAHSNGGGFVADSAKVDASAYVGPDAQVVNEAQVLGNARVEDYAIVMNRATVKDNARVSGHSLVKDGAEVSGNGKARDWATVGGNWKVTGNGRALEHAWLMDKGELTDNATIKGAVCDYGGAKVSGHAIKEADCANGVPASHQVLMCWVWGFDKEYADTRPDNEALYCNFRFSRPSPVYAIDKYGVLHGYLMGGPRTVGVQDEVSSAALQLNGKDQYVELKRDVADFKDTTIAVWVKWAGGDAGQQILHFGDGADKYATLTPKDASTGKLRFALSASGKAGEQALEGEAALPADTWTHVAVTLQGDTGTLYVDGKPVATNAKMALNPDDVLGPNCSAGSDFTFLGRGPRGGFFNGLLTDFRVYVQPQDAPAVAKLAARMKNRQAPVIVPAAAAPALAAPRFLMPPTPAGQNALVMSAVRPPKEAKLVEYSFTCTRGGGHASGWISSNRWTDCNLEPGKAYAYTVRMRVRDFEPTAASDPATAELKANATPPAPGFETAPRGIAAGVIQMAARKIDTADGLVEYQFTRGDGKSSGWQASPVFTDKDLTADAQYAYRVQVRRNGAPSLPPCAEKSAKAADTTPPARYQVGEWQTLPYAAVDNTLNMKAMSVTGENGCPKIENDPVEYYFHCVLGGGPDSGWQDSAVWKSASLPDGTYQYQFKIRDKSPAKNETPYSSAEPVKVTRTTGYHPAPLGRFAQLEEGDLVSFKGKVTAVDKDFYTVTADGTSAKVMPRTVGSATKPEMKDREVSVKGCVWKHGGEKRVVWADVE